MNKIRPFSLFVLLLGLVLLAGVLFRSFFLEILIRPIALVVWSIVRIFLSVDQKYYWSGLLMLALIFTIRHLSDGQETNEWVQLPDSNVTLENLRDWRLSISLSEHAGQDQEYLKGKLAELLVSIFTAQEPDSIPPEVYRALKRGEIPLPETVSAFLFPEEPESEKWPFKRLLRSIHRAPKKWFLRWTGREAAAFNRSIDATLAFMESFLEIKNDDEWKY